MVAAVELTSSLDVALALAVVVAAVELTSSPDAALAQAVVVAVGKISVAFEAGLGHWRFHVAGAVAAVCALE